MRKSSSIRPFDVKQCLVTCHTFFEIINTVRRIACAHKAACLTVGGVAPPLRGNLLDLRGRSRRSSPFGMKSVTTTSLLSLETEIQNAPYLPHTFE